MHLETSFQLVAELNEATIIGGRSGCLKRKSTA